MRKIILLIFACIISLGMVSTCLAFSSIKIDHADKQAVLNYAMDFVQKQYPAYKVDTLNDGEASFLLDSDLKNKADEVIGSKQQQLLLTTESEDDDVILTINCTSTVNQRNMVKEIVSDDLNREQYLLINIKRYFNDYYVFGCNPTEEEKNGGLVINIVPNSPLANQGIKSGDILIAVNDKNVLSDKLAFLSGRMMNVFDNAPVTFLIEQNDTKKIVAVKITPQLTSAGNTTDTSNTTADTTKE